MNDKARFLFDHIRECFPETDDVGVFNLMFAIDNQAYVHFMKSMTGTTWVKVPSGVCPLELKVQYSKGLEC